MSLCPLTEPEPEARALPYPMTAAKTVFIRTFGCQMNERDSEIMAPAESLAGRFLKIDKKELIPKSLLFRFTSLSSNPNMLALRVFIV